MIHRNHFSITSHGYKQARIRGLYNGYSNIDSRLQLREVTENKFEVFMGAVFMIDPSLQWDAHEKIRDKKSVREKLESPNTRLYLLIDGQSIGFAVTKPIAPEIKERFFRAANDHPAPKAVEIDYLGLYDGEAGKGRGKDYFERLYEILFSDYDTIYWSQHSTNAPTLGNFYRDQMGMKHLAQDIIPDFRKD